MLVSFKSFIVLLLLASIAMFVSGATHIVKSGETLGGIAAKYKCGVSKLVSLNNLADANKIFVGQKLKLCTTSSSGSSSSSSSSKLSMTTAGLNNIKKTLFGGNLSATKSNGIKKIVAACNTYKATLKQCAYLLGTTYLETAATMEPVREMFWTTEAVRKRELSYYPAYGRGYVQHHGNYVKASNKLGLGDKMAKNYDLALQPKYAAPILVRGCLEGWFTGAKLTTYINSSKTDYINARRVVNGTDKASTIASHAKKFEAALKLK